MRGLAARLPARLPPRERLILMIFFLPSDRGGGETLISNQSHVLAPLVQLLLLLSFVDDLLEHLDVGRVHAAACRAVIG